MISTDNFTARKNVAISLLQTKQFAKAANILESLLTLRPTDPQCLHLLGETHSMLGDFDEAELAFRKLVSLYPNIDLSHFTLGVFLGRHNKLEEAYKYLSKAHELAPQKMDTSVKAGLVSLLLGRHKRAIAHFDAVLAMNKTHPEANSLMGDALVELGELELAIPYYQTARSAQTFHLDAVAGLANIHLRKMEIDEAYKLIAPIVERTKNNPKITLIYSEICEKRGDLKTAISILLTLSEAVQMANTDKSNIYFKLGKLYDKLADYDLAFKVYELANSLINADYDISLKQKELTRYINFWNQALIRSLPAVQSPQNSVRPIFIVGMPRSGTSLTEQILASHPDISGGGELHFLQETVYRIFGNENYPDLTKEIPASTLEKEAIHYLEQLEKLKDEQNHRTTYVTDKMPNNFWHLGLIQTLFPNAKIIHCVRNPLDTCLSCYFQNFSGTHPYAYDLGSLGGYYCIYQELMLHWKSVLKIEIFELNYEDLICDFEKACKELITFCELPWDDSCLKFYESKRTVTTSSYDQARKPIHKGSVDRWRNYEKHIQPLLQALGTTANSTGLT